MTKKLLGEIELNRIYQRECIDGMRLIPDKSIDMILCDLPYGTTACKWDTIIPFEPLWAEYKRVIKKDGAIVLTCVEPFSSALVISNIDNLRESLVWEKHKPSNFGASKSKHMKYHEDIKIFSYGKPLYNPQMIKRESPRMREMQSYDYTFRVGMSEVSNQSSGSTHSSKYDPDFKLPSSIVKIPTVANNSKEKTKHPTQKPVALFEYLIKTYTNEGDIVLDNCMGSGTTAIACVRNNRNFIGFELEREYVEIANKRLDSEVSAY